MWASCCTLGLLAQEYRCTVSTQADPFNCRSLLCSPTAGNTISLNNLLSEISWCSVFVLRHISRQKRQKDNNPPFFFNSNSNFRISVSFLMKHWFDLLMFPQKAWPVASLATQTDHHNIWYLSGALFLCKTGAFWQMNWGCLECTTERFAEHVLERQAFTGHYLGWVERKYAWFSLLWQIIERTT